VPPSDFEQFRDWQVPDWADVIWTDECAFSVGQAQGTVWVTRRPGEEYLEHCLVPKLPRQSTIMVWGSIYRNLKGSLVISDLPNWARINRLTSIDKIVCPFLHPWSPELQQQDLLNSWYV